MDKDKIILLIPSAIALSMGVASFFMSILVKQSQETVMMLLSIAVFCLAIVVLNLVTNDMK